MSKDIEKMLIILSYSEKFINDDDLAKVIRRSADQELSDEELDFVVAAAKPDYQKFTDKLRKNHM